MVLVLFLLVGMTSVFAQKHVSVSGRITDELNEPMIGVSVLEKGTTNGVITDLDGNYTLSASEGSTIVFSYIGYVTQEKKAVAGTMNLPSASTRHLLEVPEREPTFCGYRRLVDGLYRTRPFSPHS